MALVLLCGQRAYLLRAHRRRGFERATLVDSGRNRAPHRQVQPQGWDKLHTVTPPRPTQSAAAPAPDPQLYLPPPRCPPTTAPGYPECPCARDVAAIFPDASSSPDRASCCGHPPAT